MDKDKKKKERINGPKYFYIPPVVPTTYSAEK